MGEVYRARDRKLDRDVAIKVLPSALAQDPERIARFEQEAKATSALNHPNILTVYDIGNEAGTLFIVMEFLDGEELRARLRDAPVPLRMAIDYAQQIVRGLAAAHEKGIVHRDLKPENVFVTGDDRVKILDFGLAKLTSSAGATTTAEEATRHAATDPGTVMGTAGYMSPEQVRGQAADHRSDIFSFGAVLYEMMTGRRAFWRDTAAETMAAILREEPTELGVSHPHLPPAIERIVVRCLAKRPERRFQSTADLAFAIDALSTPTGSSGIGLGGAANATATRSPFRSRLPWLVAGACALVAAIVLGVSDSASRSALSTASAGDRAVRLAFAPPAELGFNDTKRDAAVISPDGQKIAFTASAADGGSLLYVRTLDSGETRPLPGTVHAGEPFWSPDSRSIAFASQGKLKRIELSGGTPQVLCDVARLTGGTWSRENVIVFGADYGGQLFQVPATGGEPKPVMSFDVAGGDQQHAHPWFLPDGRHFLFNRIAADVDGADAPALTGVWAGSLDSPDLTRVLPDNTNAVYAPPGWLVFVRNQVLVAQAFSAERLQTSGDVIPIATGAATAVGFKGFSVSNTGVLVSEGAWQRQYQLVWFDRQGRQIGVLGEATPVATGAEPTLSPDGKQVAFKRAGSIWVSDLDGRTAIRLGPGQMVTWSADSREVAFASGVLGGGPAIVRRAANGVGDAELLLRGGARYPKIWSPDGKFLLYLRRGAKTRTDIWAIPRDEAGKERALLQSTSDEYSPAFSPDGRWLAFASDESGMPEIYVQSFMPDGTLGNDRRRISTSGGAVPNWRRGGEELFYVAGDGRMMSVSVRKSGSNLEVDAPQALFKTRMLGSGYTSAFHEFDVTPDGQRFLVGTLIGEPASPLPTVVVNWTASLRK